MTAPRSTCGGSASLDGRATAQISSPRALHAAALSAVATIATIATIAVVRDCVGRALARGSVLIDADRKEIDAAVRELAPAGAVGVDDVKEQVAHAPARELGDVRAS